MRKSPRLHLFQHSVMSAGHPIRDFWRHFNKVMSKYKYVKTSPAVRAPDDVVLSFLRDKPV